MKNVSYSMVPSSSPLSLILRIQSNIVAFLSENKSQANMDHQSHKTDTRSSGAGCTQSGQQGTGVWFMSYFSVNEEENEFSANFWKGGQSFAMARWLDQSRTDEPWAAVHVTGPARQKSWNYNEGPGNVRDTDGTSMKAENGSANGL